MRWWLLLLALAGCAPAPPDACRAAGNVPGSAGYQYCQRHRAAAREGFALHGGADLNLR